MKTATKIRTFLNALAASFALITLAAPQAGNAEPSASAAASAGAVPAAAPPATAVPPSAPQAGDVGSVAAVDAAYRLGAGDVVEVGILGRQDFNTRAKVSPDGFIQLPYLNSVSAANRTPTELADQIRKALEAGGFFSQPVVRVEIVGYASRYIVVLGAVGTPGLVPLDRPYRLSEIYARVGGRQATGADYIIVTKPGVESKRYSIASLATGGDAEDPYVVAGDKIYVPTIENDVFYVSGAVKSPGSYPVTPGMSIRMALAKAGGVTEEGNDKKVTVHRGQEKRKMKPEELVKVGDVLIVGTKLF